MKKILSFFLALVICVALLPAIAPLKAEAAGSVGGYGSNGKFLAPIDPPDPDAIKIYTPQDLNNIRYDSDESYVLMNDIDLSGFNGGEWVPIDDFYGVFDGQGHVIRNLTITDCIDHYIGLFGRVIDATTKNVGMENTYIETSPQTWVSVGSICGLSSDSSIINCYNAGLVSSFYSDNTHPEGGNINVGGICGEVNCYSSINPINNCYNTGMVSSSGDAGGICSEIYFTSNIESDTIAINNCHNAGTVSSYVSAGGIFSRGVNFSNKNIYINNCYNTGMVSSVGKEDAYPDGEFNTYTGGICGRTGGINISNCYNMGMITTHSHCDYAFYGGFAYAGGICGDSRSSISNCYNTGTVFSSSEDSYSGSDSYAGGICGGDGSSISNCYNTGAVMSSTNNDNSSALVGGICGGSSTSIIYCYNTGSVYSLSYANSYAFSGGICYVSNFISQCYNIGAVSSSSYLYSAYAGGISSVGGLNSIIDDCYNTGAVSSSTYAGGISGAVGGNSTTSNCYNTGAVSSSIYAGGISNFVYSHNPSQPFTITNCYCLNLNGSTYGNQLTSVQMKNKAYYSEWDFSSVWNISSSKNNGYPYLRGMTLVTGGGAISGDYLEDFNYNPNEYNHDLALECAEYSMLAYDNYYRSINDSRYVYYKEEGVRRKSPIDLERKLTLQKFDTILPNNYYNGIPHDVSFVIAKKNVFYNGVPRTLVAVIIRGTDGIEWQGNMDITGASYNATQSNHYSFESAMENVRIIFNGYLQNNEIDNALVLTTGHSRGGAVANLLAYDLSKNPGNYSNRVDQNGVFAYTFAAPNCTRNADLSILNIFNFCFKDDFIPQVPLIKWGYGKHGQQGELYETIAQNLNSGNLGFINDMSVYAFLSKLSKGNSKNADFDYNATKDVLSYVEGKWNTVNKYYSTINKTSTDYNTLYSFMRNVVANAAMEHDLNLIEKLLSYGNKLRASRGDSSYGPIAEFFVKGWWVLAKAANYVDNTHSAFTYYAALKNNGFPIDGGGGFKSAQLSVQALSSVIPTNPNTAEVAALVAFAQQDDNLQNLGWDLGDLTTWDGIEWSDSAENCVTGIDLSYRELTGALDVSGFAELKELDCSGNYLDGICTDNCYVLETMNMAYNSVTALSLDNCSALQTLNCSWNQLETLDASGFGALARLYCDNNKLSVLDVSNNPELEELYCSENDLTYLDVTANAKLAALSCESNYMDVNNDASLRYSFDAIENMENGWVRYEPQKILPTIPFSAADVAKLSAFAAQGGNMSALLWAPGTPQDWLGVEWIKVGGEYRVRGLSIGNFELTGSLDLSGMPYLEYVSCSNNDLPVIDISNCPVLTHLSCSSSKTIQLDTRNCPSLAVLYCTNNYLDLQNDLDLRGTIDYMQANDLFVNALPQKIMASSEDFNQDEYSALVAFAGTGDNLSALGWDIDKPGEWQGVSWELFEGEYRATGISMAYLDVYGDLDLQGFVELTDVDFAMTGISSVALPNSLTAIGDYAFYDCVDLTQIILPDALLAIGSDVFYNNALLSEIDLPDGLTEIGDNAFRSCSALISIVIPGSVTTIGNEVFYGCESLVKVEFMGDAPTAFGEDVFSNVANGFIIYYYSDAYGWTKPEWNGYPTRLIDPNGVNITGQVRSYNPKLATKIKLYEAGAEQIQENIIAETEIEALLTGSGVVTQDFTLEGIPEGTYDLVVAKRGNLSYTITNIIVDDEDVDLTLNTTKTYSTIILSAGDINDDGRVNVYDVTYLLIEYNKVPTVWPYADIDGSGSVNVQDITYLLVNYNKVNAVISY